MKIETETAQREITPDSNNETPFAAVGADIEGRTSFEHVLSAACDWVKPGGGSSVFPAAGSLPLESGVSMNQLFS